MQLAGAPSVLSPRRNVAKRNDLHKRPCNPASRPCVDGPFVKNCGRLSASPFKKCYIAEASVLIPQFWVVVNVHVKWVPRRAHPHASQKIRASPSRIPPETLFIFFLGKNGIYRCLLSGMAWSTRPNILRRVPNQVALREEILHRRHKTSQRGGSTGAELVAVLVREPRWLRPLWASYQMPYFLNTPQQFHTSRKHFGCNTEEKSHSVRAARGQENDVSEWFLVLYAD